MKNLVAYSSRNGNTKLIADEIVKELGCKIVNLDEVDCEALCLDGINNVFIGGGVYWGNYSESITKFAELLNSRGVSKKKPLKLAFFVTWLGRGNSNLNAVNNCRKLIPSKWINAQDSVFSCMGESFKLIRRGHPDEDDFINARSWVRDMVSVS